MENDDARAALDLVSRSDRKMVGQTGWPLWRHAAFGLVQALFVLAWGLPVAAMAATIVVAIAATSWIVHDDRRRYGMFVDGWSSSAARPATWASVALFVGALAILFAAGDGPNHWSPIVPIVTAVVFVGSTLLSIWWQKLYHADMARARSDG
ncbi:hypothetical protein WJS89_07270 [Sphingomicrobium sp. XHP0235]|uniref:hypothetical protein n=1 Tax=Sphingomicrobium aquimarinum TaxID=3133971 RepID=UPI0031FE4CCE